MSQTVGDYLVQRMREWGITRVFGYPGDGINGIMGAFNRAAEAGEGPEWIQVRHEEMSAFMACGHAKFTGEVGVCVATSGPGAIHLLNGLYDAKMDHQPVLAIVGQFAASQEVPDFSYAQYAEMLGLKGIRVDHPDQVRPAWEEAFAANRPVVLDAITDPDVPLLPPHISLEQAKAFASALWEGDPDQAGIIKQTIKAVANSVLPNR